MTVLSYDMTQDWDVIRSHNMTQYSDVVSSYDTDIDIDTVL